MDMLGVSKCRPSSTPPAWLCAVRDERSQLHRPGCAPVQLRLAVRCPWCTLATTPIWLCARAATGAEPRLGGFPESRPSKTELSAGFLPAEGCNIAVFAGLDSATPPSLCSAPVTCLRLPLETCSTSVAWSRGRARVVAAEALAALLPLATSEALAMSKGSSLPTRQQNLFKFCFVGTLE